MFSLKRNKEITSRNFSKNFLVALFIGFIALLVMAFVFISFGAEDVPFNDIIGSIFNFDSENFNHSIIINIRLPRLLADLMVGASLAVAGAVMQGTTKNPMADSGIMGISSGSVFAVVIIVVFFPNISRLGRIGMSALGAAIVTFLIYFLAFLSKKKMSSESMVLSGMAVSTLLSSLTTAIILKEGISGEMMRYTAGSSANTIWNDIYIAGPFFIVALVVSFLISHSLTIMNLGEEVSKGLGANTFIIKLISTIVVLLLSAIAVVIIGPVGYVGLMIPHIVRHFVGTDYRFVLPLSALYGGVLVLICDFLARLIIAPYEFPIGVIIVIIGVPFFIYTSRKEKGDNFEKTL